MELATVLPRSNPPPEDALPDHRVEPICRKYIHTRYELMPYFYTLSRQAFDEGMPMMRPLWFMYPEDQVASGIGHEYLLGDSLLIAPVTAKGTEKWDVYLPEGIWYDYFTGAKYHGGNITVDARLENIPVFVCAGAIIPKAPVTQYISIDKKNDFDELMLTIYAGADGSYTLYEDDGISLGYQRGENSSTLFTWEDTKGKLSAKGHSSMFPGASRKITATVLPENRQINLVVQYS